MNEYQVMPPLSPEEYEELKADIKERGVMIPIEFDEDGNTLDDAIESFIRSAKAKECDHDSNKAKASEDS